MYAVKAAKRQAKGTADRDRMLKEVRPKYVGVDGRIYMMIAYRPSFLF